jgi:hypothetical protein
MSLVKIFRSPFFWLFAFLLVVEFAATMVTPYRQAPAASGLARNPLPLRGWPEYLRAGSETIGAINVAIIGNSQGAGGEIEGAEHLYPALLEKAFKDAGRNINIENWSLVGLRTDQIELLSMIAAQRHLDLLLIVTEIKSLDIAGHTRLGANSDDLDLVAGKPILWPGIRASHVLHETKWDELLRRYMFLHSSMVRLRTHLLDLLARKIPPVAHPLLFGQRRSQRALDSVNTPVNPQFKANENSLGRNKTQENPVTGLSVPATTWEKQFRRNRIPTFNNLFPGLRRRLTDSGTTLIWIWMPIYPGANTASLRKGAEPIYSVICNEIRAAGTSCLNMTNSLPAENYITLSASSHFNPKGHEAMSRLLQPVIENALH